MSAVVVTMRSGEKHRARGYEGQIAEQINGARGDGKLIPLERDTIPTGQMFHIDPDEVESVKDVR